MNSGPLKSIRLRRWIWVLGSLALLGIGWFSWVAVHRTRIARQAIPSRPELEHAALIDEISVAESTARSWGWRHSALARLGGLYHANGFFNEALMCYRGLAALEPRNAQWPYLIAHIEASFGRIAAALPEQRRAAQLASDNFMVHLRLGDILLKNNSIAEAETAYARALQIEPVNPYALLGRARCALRREDWSAADEHLRRAVKAQPSFVAAWTLLADIEERRGNPAAAAEARKHGDGQFREITDPWLSFLNDLCYDPYQLSIVAATTSDRAHARELVERAIALAPDVPAHRRQLAKLLIADGDMAAARMHLEKAVALAPDDAEAWSALVTLLMDLQNGRAAMAALAEGLRHCPQSGFLHFTNGRRLAATGRPAEAEAEFKLAQRLQPTEIRSYIELSTLYVQMERVPDAIAQAKAALAVDPGNAMVLGMLAQLSILQGDETAALHWARTLKAHPKKESAEVLRATEAMFEEQFSRPMPR